MNDALFGTIAAAGLSVAFLHAALPTHWLPFVLAGRRQRWTRGRTLAITALAGSGHVVFTIVLGIAVAWLGFAVDRWAGQVFPYIAACVLAAFGVYYWVRGSHHHLHAHAHVHAPAGPAPLARAPADDEDEVVHAAQAAIPLGDDRAVIVGLVTLLTFSPCEGFLPIFVAGARFGWAGFALLCAILVVATLAGMVLLTWLTLVGLERVPFETLERYEGRLAGALLLALALVLLTLET